MRKLGHETDQIWWENSDRKRSKLMRQFRYEKTQIWWKTQIWKDQIWWENSDKKKLKFDEKI